MDSCLDINEDTDLLYVINVGTSSVTVINATTNKVLFEIPLGPNVSPVDIVVA